MDRPDLPTPAVIQEAEVRIRPRLAETPLWRSPDLDAVQGFPVTLKCENLQRTGSFKARGALNWILSATERELAPGLVTVSAGNHAIALAWAAKSAGASLTVVMPEGSSRLKVRRTRELGAEVLIRGRIQDAVAHCHHLVEYRGMTLVHPYNDVRIMAGQGTVGLELLRQQREVTRILCPVGGGGLISGLGLAVKAVAPDIELIGVEPEGAATMGNAWKHNDPAAALETVDTWAASLAPAVVGEHTYAASRQVVDRMVTVSEAAIRRATRLLLSEARLFVEPGAAVGLAALLEGTVEADRNRPAALIITGGNLDLDQVSQCEVD
ncbi:L-threonine ammonia-lyase [Marinobacter daqiaonensis]|uniref:L-threonine ammonia-lyase n=1 Tax=Marinobacter daqiaonensis TaxID=650891 RepID=A0A1I6JAS2_9GAMM|nr:threonine/serine dehydratase [Marinobacter daqiaonensis]SFR76051.1 L-threonine ammonia-lyase [Marinobacter daqiaonensis]